MERKMKAAYAERRAPEALIRSVILKVGAARRLHKETAPANGQKNGTAPEKQGRAEK